MSKTKLTASDWELVKNAPYWVNQILAQADGRVSFFARRREGKALDKAIADYTTKNALVNDIIADGSDAPSAIGKASQADAEKALNRIATIVEEKLGSDDLAALSDFLRKVGHQVASASKEGGAGNAAMVSEKEAAALTRLESVMKVSSAYATAHTPASSPKPAAKPSSSAKPAPAPAKRDDDAKAREEAAKKQTEARERLEKARADAEAKAEAKKKEEASARLEKARAEAEQRQAEAKAKAEAEAAKASEEAARKEAEAKAAASAPKYTQFIAEHTVQPGDNLSFISERYYGTQANFRILYEANRDVIGDNMNLIKPGQVLKIPKL
ncbi:MAG: LysM peptidoglycan-binding domain-containing protein [Candidatus Promineofilum sp.]|nr:LysM peptidoglycan-binding domain-containing protein [Promineifilum sp.]